MARCYARGVHFLSLFWLFLPAFVANAAPVVVRNIPGLKEWKRPIAPAWLGQNKTWRGFLSGLATGALTGLLQGLWSAWVRDHSGVILPSLAWGALLGFGALLGDAVKSFAKRRIGIAPGHAWPVFDGVDYMIGALTVAALFLPLTLWDWVFLCALGPLASWVANVGAYWVGWKEVWW